ncbi:MAG: MotA/TolQ/ExbB proton channel family protein [Bdellovibrionales bacterium]|nr:MotA/TolQ/ExbB proton channel family protein [Bdellovibrionales bacterium]
MTILTEVIETGGWVSYPLILVAFLLSYFLALRFFHLKILENSQLLTLKNNYFTSKLWVFERQMARGFAKNIVKNLVVVAPLLGLLGTVVGMIETFDSLDGQHMYSSSGGIAGGISQAMFTTEMGLLISIPGLLVSRWLERKQNILFTQDQCHIAKLNRMENI